MNDDTSLGTRLDQLQTSLSKTAARAEDVESVPQLVALRQARQRAADARAAAERVLREAHAAEVRLVAQEEQAIAAAAVAERNRLADLARAALAAEQQAVEILSAVQGQVQRVSLTKAQTQAAVAAIQAALAQHESQLRAAEASECTLQSDLAIAERKVQECTRAREKADAALDATAQQLPEGIGPAPGPSERESPSLLSVAAQRAAERREADAARIPSS